MHDAEFSRGLVYLSDVDIRMDTHAHVVQSCGLTSFMHNRQKRFKKNGAEIAVATLKKGDCYERGLVTEQCPDRSGKPDKRSEKKLEQKSSQRRSSNPRLLG